MRGNGASNGFWVGALLPLTLAACQAANEPKESDSCTWVREGYGPNGTTPLRAETVVDGLEVPWAIAFLPGGEMLVTERSGRIRKVADGKLLPDPLATVPVKATGEAGLMGIALHPDFASNRLVYLALTGERAGQPENRVERWRVSEDGTKATMDRIILQGIPAHAFHDGGRIKIGPDRMLYVSTGDAGEPHRSQDLQSLGGKLLRVDLEGNVPADNPFPDSPVFLLGLRNPQGFDWLDAKTLVLSDHGPSGELGRRGGDELNVAEAGANLGWPSIWHCEEMGKLLAPVLTWTQAVPSAGVAVFHGTSIPGWDGSVVVSTLGSRHLHRVVLERGKKPRVASHEVYFQGDPPAGLGRLREAIMGPDGHLYLTTSNCDGRGICPEGRDRIVRIVAGS